jgi:hypothetical protein
MDVWNKIRGKSKALYGKDKQKCEKIFVDEASG